MSRTPTTPRQLLITYLSPQRARVLALALLLFVNIGLQLVNPQLLRHFIDTAQAGGASTQLLITALAFLGVALMTQGVNLGATYVSERVSWAATNALRADLTAHCLQLDLAFHTSHTPGELIERIDGDVTALANFFSQFVLQVLGNLLLLVGVLVVLFVEDWRIGVALSVFVGVALSALLAVRDIAAPSWAAALQARADLFGFLEERLAAIEDLRANGATGYVLRQLGVWTRRMVGLEMRARLMLIVILSTSLGIFTLGNLVALAVGGALFQVGAITLGTVYLIFTYTTMLRRPLGQITDQLTDLQTATASIARINALWQHPTESQQVGVLRYPAGDTQAPAHTGRPDALGVALPDALPTGPLALTLEAVSFAYDPSEPLLQDISLTLAPGEVLGVLGRTGSGKSTLTRLLFRFYRPSGGLIRLGGEDIWGLPLALVRQRVGMVTQDVQLFNATVRQNLTFFAPDLPDQRVIQALHEVGLGEWYSRLPQGLDSPLAGNRGLSAGEAQLLAFARLFLKDPGLIVLDEASSRLDPATEQRLEQALDRLLAQRTAIIIAHRLATVQRADKILILERGQVVAYGPRHDLAQNPHSRFAQLLRTGLDEVLV